MRLKITTPKRSFEFAAREGTTVIIVGTRALDDICIDDDPKVSGPHVRLEGSGQHWSFTDQFSDAGTIHNGAKTYNGDLKVGDVLKVGDSEIKVLELEGSVAAPAPAFEPKFDTAMASSGATPDDHAAGTPTPHAGETPASPSVFVQRIVNRLVLQFNAEHGFSIQQDAAAMARVRDAAEKAVRELEAAKSTEVNLPFLAADASGPKHLTAHLARKHLHETGEPTPARPQQAAPSSPTAAAKPNQKPGVAIAVAIVLIVATSMVIFTALEDAGDVEQDVSQIIKEAESKQREQDSRQEQERLLQQSVVALMEDKETRPQELMDRLDQLEGVAKAQGMAIGWDFQRARTYLESRVYSDVSIRSNDVSGEVYDLQEQKKYRDAAELVKSLDAYLDASPHNARAIEVLELDESVERWNAEIAAGSEKLLAAQIPATAEAQSRDDFSAAVEALQPVVDGALLDDAVLKVLRDEFQELKAKAAKQEQGDLPRGRRPFDKRKDKLPESPDNALLKAGDYTARTSLSSIRYNIIEGVRKGEWDGRKIQVWGLSAEVRGDSKTTHVALEFTHTVGDQTIKFTSREQLSNYPPAIQLALFEQLVEPELQDRMAMLIYAFDNGLMDDAGRLALKVREAAPDLRAELDAILAAKWKVEVPEGGFPERDGRVVAE